MPKQLNELARNTGVRLTLSNLFKVPCRKTGCLCIRAGGRSKPGVAGAAFEHPLERVAEDPTIFFAHKGGARSMAGMTCRFLHLNAGAEARGILPPPI